MLPHGVTIFVVVVVVVVVVCSVGHKLVLYFPPQRQGIRKNRSGRFFGLGFLFFFGFSIFQLVRFRFLIRRSWVTSGDPSSLGGFPIFFGGWVLYLSIDAFSVLA